MSNIDKRALRKELSNPAIGSNAHLRKLALALLDELESAEKLNAELMEKQRLIDICQGQGLEHRIAAEKRAEAAEKRIAELEARQVDLEHIGYIQAEEGAFYLDESMVKSAICAAGIRINGKD